MALAVVQAITAGTVSGTSISFASWTPSANELLLVAVALRDETRVPTVAGNGLTWVQVADVDNIQSQCGINLFRAMGASPSAGAVVITLTGNSKPASAVAIRISGANTSGTNGSGAVENVFTNRGPTKDNDNLKTAVTTLTSAAWAAGFGTHRRKLLTVPSGETAISINNHVGSSGDQTSVSAWYESVASPSTVTVGENGDLNDEVDWAMIGVSISSGPINFIVNPSPAVCKTLAVGAPPAILTTGTRVFEPSPASCSTSTLSPVVVLPVPTIPFFVLRPSLEIWICDPLGNRLAFVEDIVSASAVRLVDAVGSVTLRLPGDFDQSILQVDGQIEVWRSPYFSGALRLETVGFMRYISYEEDSDGIQTIVVGGPDQMDLLARRIVAYSAGSAQASKTAALDDMMKAIVRENLGSLAVAGRDLTALNFTVEADRSDGTISTRSFAWKNVLQVLQELSDLSRDLLAPIYFDVVPVVISQTRIGFQFRTYPGQRGVDRSRVDDPLLFGSGSGDIVAPALSFDYRSESNYVYTGGQGEGAARVVSEDTNTARTGRSPWNRRELFADARNEATLAGVTATGQGKIEENKPYVRFSGSLRDSPITKYGIDWDLGDLIPVTHMERQFVVSVNGVKIEIKDSGDTSVESKFEVVG